MRALVLSVSHTLNTDTGFAIDISCTEGDNEYEETEETADFEKGIPMPADAVRVFRVQRDGGGV